MDTDAFYEAGIVGLRWLDARGVPPARFGADAQAHWDAFKGGLGTPARIDILLKDAAVQFGPAFHPPSIFKELRPIPEDDLLGPRWPSLSEERAKKLWKTKAPADPDEVIARWAEILGVASAGKGKLPKIAATERVLAVGARGAWRAFQAFRGSPGLDWCSQVVVVASEPCERQFAGLLATVASLGATRVVHPEEIPADRSRVLVEATKPDARERALAAGCRT